MHASLEQSKSWELGTVYIESNEKKTDFPVNKSEEEFPLIWKKNKGVTFLYDSMKQ